MTDQGNGTGTRSGDGPAVDHSEAARVFDEHRGLLFAVAYRMLGRVADAEDVVQDAWLRWVNAEPAEVQHPRAFLVRVASRLAIDRMRWIKARHEAYIGPWLPEPVLTGPDVAEQVELADSVSMALLVVLETLSPLERAVFVLHEAFGYAYAEIAAIIGRSEAAVRQLGRRAHDHVQERRPRFEPDEATRSEVTERFLQACNTGDLEALMQILAPGVTFIGDTGGRVRAPRRPIEGVERVIRVLMVSWAEPIPDRRIHVTTVNGGPGLVATSGDTPVAALTLGIADGRVQTVYLVANPDKLFGLRAEEAL